jgi:hypothetical protein
MPLQFLLGNNSHPSCKNIWSHQGIIILSEDGAKLKCQVIFLPVYSILDLTSCIFTLNQIFTFLDRHCCFFVHI